MREGAAVSLTGGNLTESAMKIQKLGWSLRELRIFKQCAIGNVRPFARERVSTALALMIARARVRASK